MAEQLGRIPSEVAANRKALFDSQGVTMSAVIELPAVNAFANGDTVATGLFIKKGFRLICPPTVSTPANTAALTVSVGLRDATTKVVTDATAVINAASLAAASTSQVNTGTKLINGQRYVMLADQELYLTFAGATPAVNSVLRIEVPYIRA